MITVPYYFNDARRKATQDAGRIAGLNVIDIINEPTAATLTYAWHHGELGASGKRTGGRGRTLVYDLGGGTFDVTVVRFTPTHFQVLATDGDVQLGGVDWNDRLLDYVADEFKARYGDDPRAVARTVQMLRNDCDLAKIELSEKTGDRRSPAGTRARASGARHPRAVRGASPPTSCSAPPTPWTWSSSRPR